ncbi:MAG: type VI secretion system-associated FHA domain protein TagH [Marinobacter sp.]|nr:type VI secretion system-associated FHA domain protein TagH [Marinobacter sp.]
MELELAITSYQRLSPTVVSSHRFSSSGVFTLGRAKECDWFLPDPDRVISSRHAEVFCQGGQFFLRDTSTNGVFVNGASSAVGKGAEVALQDGDRLRFGDYEFKVSLKQSEPAVTMPASAPLGAAVAESAPIAALDLPRPDAPLDPRQPLAGSQSGLASALTDRSMLDSHVDIPETTIPPVWSWGEASKSAPEPQRTGADKVPAPGGNTATLVRQQPAAKPGKVGGDNDALIQALVEGLGMPDLDASTMTPELMRELGGVTRHLLDRLLDLLRARAEQKQKLRVQQTLFQRSENNPLKFSATAQDALDALLLRRHASFLAPDRAIEAAFSDILSHERAVLKAVERVVDELLDDKLPAVNGGGVSLFRKARSHDEWVRRRQRLREDYGSSSRMLRSDVFVEAYEAAVREGEQQ